MFTGAGTGGSNRHTRAPCGTNQRHVVVLSVARVWPKPVLANGRVSCNKLNGHKPNKRWGVSPRTLCTWRSRRPGPPPAHARCHAWSFCTRLRKTHLLLSFPYVCSAPVLAKTIIYSTKWRKRRVSLGPNGQVSDSTRAKEHTAPRFASSL